jgi:two-component system sensor histidine kinase PilS (NtrC family)
MLDPRRMLRWVWLGRVVLSCAILVAAVFVWNRAEPSDTLIATLAFAVATLATVASAMYGEFEQRTHGSIFYGIQCAIDLGLVTAIVHITGGWNSQFAALYILVIASGALLLPFRGGLAVAAVACVLYIADILWLTAGIAPTGVTVQIGVFVVVAVGSGIVSLRLREAGVGRNELAAELVKVQLEASEILRTIRSGIITVDAEGRLLYANPAASDLLGINLRLLTGRPALHALRPVAPQLAQVLEDSWKNGVRTTRAEGLIKRDGELVEIGVTTTVPDASDGETRHSATAIFQDISDTKRLMALNVRAERLEAVAELSASLAHEIRNPLASIRSATEQLARRRGQAAQPADEDERILHDLVVREADRLSRLLGDFLDFARTSSAVVQPLDVGAVVNAATTLVSAHPARGANVHVAITVDPATPLIAGDEDLLHRAVFNLVLNAIQAVGTDGRVDVRVAPASAFEHHLPSAAIARMVEPVIITVADNGNGIPMEMRDRMFEPFVSNKPGGTGLGLPLVHRAVEAHHGLVFVDALPQGTRFTVVLPSTGEPATAATIVSPATVTPDEPIQHDDSGRDMNDPVRHTDYSLSGVGT